jgi:hypothetical protein
VAGSERATPISHPSSNQRPVCRLQRLCAPVGCDTGQPSSPSAQAIPSVSVATVVRVVSIVRITGPAPWSELAAGAVLVWGREIETGAAQDRWHAPPAPPIPLARWE